MPLLHTDHLNSPCSNYQTMTEYTIEIPIRSYMTLHLEASDSCTDEELFAMITRDHFHEAFESYWESVAYDAYSVIKNSYNLLEFKDCYFYRD